MIVSVCCDCGIYPSLRKKRFNLTAKKDCVACDGCQTETVISLCTLVLQINLNAPIKSLQIISMRLPILFKILDRIKSAD